VDELLGQVLVEWDRTPSNVCRNVIESKPRRIGAVIKAKGAQTSTSKKTDSSSLLDCKLYIKLLAETEVLNFGRAKDTISTFLFRISHGFTFVPWATI